ncbi:hypothetical protein BU14_0537s0017 [Porphyra umbilicalis]|uniref:Uncharacterized protein n=1 Tax=Porphyra umbilicalis TaxID=2786 RepID=A0A1X6NSB0_PORUM|nr:hypothetical protein BU14_0537s0017 [Porphyra umbilicalis]|eukprot:OSX71410.1 hypothetical protein BU14_0537s0017 [Porphyra umbilicalis]
MHGHVGASFPVALVWPSVGAPRPPRRRRVRPRHPCLHARTHGTCRLAPSQRRAATAMTYREDAVDEGGRLAARPPNGVQRAAAVAAAKRDLVQEGHTKLDGAVEVARRHLPRLTEPPVALVGHRNARLGKEQTERRLAGDGGGPTCRTTRQRWVGQRRTTGECV